MKAGVAFDSRMSAQTYTVTAEKRAPNGTVFTRTAEITIVVMTPQQYYASIVEGSF